MLQLDKSRKIPKCHPERKAKGGRGLCENCYAKQRRDRMTPEQKKKAREIGDRWRKENRPRFLSNQRRYHYKTKYNISIEEYDRMYRQQAGKCGICKKEKKLFIDHNHVTDKIRGLLCLKCNFAIGYAYEDIEITKAMTKYLTINAPIK